MMTSKGKEGYFGVGICPKCTAAKCHSNNDLHPCAANQGATPWVVVPPCWIGQYDQGNGVMGDDIMSGQVFYKAY